MRILLVNQTARVHTGGTHRMVVESCEWLLKTGHTVAVACWDGQPGEVECAVHALPASDSASTMCEVFQKVLSDFKPDVVQLHLTENDFFISEVGGLVPTSRFLHDQAWFCSSGDRMTGNFNACHREHGLSCLFWHYAQRCGGKDPRGNWARWQLVGRKQSLRGAAGIRLQVASQFMRRGLLENGYDAERIDVIPLFANESNVVENVEPGLIVTACRLVKSKGVHILIEALADIFHLPWKLAIAGDGPKADELKALAAHYGLTDRIQFLGEISPAALDTWYARAAIIVTSTLRPEPFGLIGPEAMAHGKPVVAFAGGATEEWLVHGETGLLVSDRTSESLAHGLQELLEKPDKARQMGRIARARWEQYRPDHYVERVISSFERCIREFKPTI